MTIKPRIRVRVWGSDVWAKLSDLRMRKLGGAVGSESSWTAKHDWLSYRKVDKADPDFLSERPAIIEERVMARTIEKVEYALERARRERDAWQHNRTGQSNYEMAIMMVSALEKELS